MFILIRFRQNKKKVASLSSKNVANLFVKLKVSRVLQLKKIGPPLIENENLHPNYLVFQRPDQFPPIHRRQHRGREWVGGVLRHLAG